MTFTFTYSILQEDLQNFVNRTFITSNSNVILANVNHYRVNELQAADRTLEQVVRYYLDKAHMQKMLDQSITDKPSANIIGIFTLDFHNEHNCHKLKCMLQYLDIEKNQIILEGGSIQDR